MIRYHARWVLPISRPPIPDATVVEDRGRVVYVGPRSAAPPGEDADLGDAILLPGLVNAHTHLELTGMRGLLEGLDFRAWIATLQAAKREVLSADAMLDAARAGIAEGLAAGVTTFADTCHSGVALRAMRELGVRGVVYQEVFGPAPERCAESMRELGAKIDALRAEETALQRVGISPHAPYTVSDAVFAAAAAYARAEALPVAVHIAESEAETQLIAEGCGPFAEALRARGISVAARARSPLALLERLGVLATRALLIHCVRADAADLAAIAAARCGVAHCPSSNAKLGHGVAPLSAMLERGIAVGLGSDSVASNNRMHLLEEARLASLLQRAELRTPHALSPGAALELATLGGARALGLDAEIGSLETGKAADLAAFPLGVLPGAHVADPAAAAVFALGGTLASLVAVGGRVLVRDGRVLGADPDVTARVRASGDALAAWKRARGAAP
jgi:5-methylthioadenosine/S-adenosylhomocysteine deaminase